MSQGLSHLSMDDPICPRLTTGDPVCPLVIPFANKLVIPFVHNKQVIPFVHR